MRCSVSLVNVEQIVEENPKAFKWLYIVFSTIFTAFNAISVTVMYDEASFPVLQSTWVRYIVVWTVTTPLYFCYIPDRHVFGSTKQEGSYLMTRSLLFFGGLNFYLLSMIFLPIGFATTLVFTHPFFTMFGMSVYYRQKPSVNGLLLIVGGFGSLILMFAPWQSNPARFDPRWRFGVVLAFASALSRGIAHICKDKLRSNIHWIQVEYVTSLLFVIGIIPLSWLFQYIYIKTTGWSFISSQIFFSDPVVGH